MPDLKVEIPRIARPDVYILLAPFLPGVLLLASVVTANLPLFIAFFQTTFIGYYSKLACVVLLTYVLGQMLMTLANIISFALAATLLPYVPNRSSTENKPWHHPEWRKLTRRFVGAELTPATDFPFNVQNYEAVLQAAKQIANPEEQNRALSQLFEARDALMGADREWLNWYFILRNYTRSEEAEKDERFSHQLGYLFNACGIAGLVLLTLVPEARNSFLWFLFGSGNCLAFCFRLQFVTASHQLRSGTI
jgi:hypothetical protein